jgi:hypothetical protein
MASIRLGDLLIKAKVISESQLKAALAEQQKWGGKLGELLVRMNFLTEDMLVKALSKQMNVPSVNLEALPPVRRTCAPSCPPRRPVTWWCCRCSCATTARRSSWPWPSRRT